MNTMLRFEWRRISTIRSTYVLAVAMLAFGGVFAFANAKEAPRDSLVGWAFTGGFVAAFIGAQAIGHEYRYGTIRLTLASFPSRSRVLSAKVGVAVAVVVGAGLVSALLAFLLTVTRATESIPLDTAVGRAGSGLLYVVVWCLLGFALAAITRQLALGVIIPLVSMAIVEPLLLGMLGSRLPWLDDALPMRSLQALVLGPATGGAFAVVVAWLGACLGAAYILVNRRDA